MKTREQFESESKYMCDPGERLLMQILLDIRDLLQQNVEKLGSSGSVGGKGGMA